MNEGVKCDAIKINEEESRRRNVHYTIFIVLMINQSNNTIENHGQQIAHVENNVVICLLRYLS